MPMDHRLITARVVVEMMAGRRERNKNKWQPSGTARAWQTTVSRQRAEPRE